MPRERDNGESPNTAGDKRRAAMIEAAYTLFTEKGFASVSVDDIIRVSKGSKSSLYKYFGNKEGILKAVVEAHAKEMLRHIDVEFPSGRTPREALTRIGMVLVDLALSENAINQYRHAVAHAKLFPEVARLWYECGPKSTFDGLARYLGREAAAGRLRIADPERAALFFAGMIIFKDNLKLSVCLPPAKRSELKAVVAEAVDVFLAAYGR